MYRVLVGMVIARRTRYIGPYRTLSNEPCIALNREIILLLPYDKEDKLVHGEEFKGEG